MAEITPSGMVMYLFGDRNPEISTLMSDPEFQALVRQLLSSGETRLSPSWARVAEAAARCGLLAREGDLLRAGPRLVPIPAAAEADLPSLMRPTLANYVEITREVTSDLRSAYQTTAPGRCFEWPRVSHTMIAGMFLDMAMGNEIYGSGQILRRPVGDTVVWAFEQISARNAYGVQWTPGPGRTAFTQIWHRHVRRSDIRLTSLLVELMSHVALSGNGSSGAKELLYLRHLGLVRKAGPSLEIAVPVFGPADAEALLPILVEGARRLVADAITPALDSLAHHPWWRERYQQDRYRHAAVRAVLEYGIDRVILAKVLEPFPEDQDLPVEWGRWLWMEPEGPLTLMPNVVSRQSGEVPG